MASPTGALQPAHSTTLARRGEQGPPPPPLTLEEAQRGAAGILATVLSDVARDLRDERQAARIVMFNLFGEAIQNVRGMIDRINAETDRVVAGLAEVDGQLLLLNRQMVQAMTSGDRTTPAGRERVTAMREDITFLTTTSTGLKQEIKRTNDLFYEVIEKGADQVQGRLNTLAVNLYEARMRELTLIGTQLKYYNKELNQAQRRRINEQVQALKEESQRFEQVIRQRQAEDASWKMHAEHALAQQAQADATALKSRELEAGHSATMAKIRVEQDKIHLDAQVRKEEIGAAERTRVVEAAASVVHPRCSVM